MPETTPVPTGPHTPMSNESTEGALAATLAPAPPSVGALADHAVPEGAAERIERPPVAESVAAESAPDTSALRDVGSASFPDRDFILETVHGPDDRVQINPTTPYPYRANASLLITARDGTNWVGTGWFIGPRTLVTAGHCVCIKHSGFPARDGWVTSIRVMPGRNGSELPFGSVTSQQFRSVRGWVVDGNEEFDYGVIILPVDKGTQLGWYGFAAFADGVLTASVGNISGYPGDKPGTQWYHSNTIASVGPNKVFYDIDTKGGQSGSVVYVIRDADRIGVGVHAYGGPSTNSGTRITAPVQQNLTAWRV